MERIVNFSAGPSILPKVVLEQAQKELLSYEGRGFSVLEMSHRSSYFENIVEETEHLLRKLMNIPANYNVLFLQGGASLQFSMVPINLLTKTKHALYVDTGTWAEKAVSEARKIGKVSIISSSKDQKYTYIPSIDLSKEGKADYLHITTNNTIEGTRYTKLPETGNIPLVADMSSNILSEVYDVSKFGLIYAGAQKNLGPAGLTIVIIRDDLVGNAPNTCPTMLDYKTYASSTSLYNTPPTFSIYITKLVLQWLDHLGGIQAIEAINRKKAAILYDFIDQSSLFHSKVNRFDRSFMNIPFSTNNPDLDAHFIKIANEEGLIELKGHRSIGGMRASLYNAMPVEGVERLVLLMKRFEEARHVSSSNL